MNLCKNGKKLCVKYFDESCQKYILTFSNEFHRSVEINFFSGDISFLICHIHGKDYFLYRGYDKNTFFAYSLSSSSSLKGRIYLNLPKSTRPYTEKSNYNGMFYVYDDIPALAKFNESTLDIIELKKKCR